MKLDEVLQWAGTACFMVMYTTMSFFKEQHVLQLTAGCLGGLLFLAWSLRVVNRQQTIVNITGVAITLVGLYRAIG
jgi:hypothetical protein